MTAPVPTWRTEPIRNFASIGTGNKDTQDRTAFGRYPFFVRSQKVERIDSWAFDGEAVLTAGDGVGTGKVFHYVTGKFDYHQRVYRISNFREDVNGRYFFYQFSRNFLARIEALTAKSSVDSVRMETIAGMEVALPERREQDRIAEVLDSVSELIGALERMIAKNRALKQGVRQQLLMGSSEWRQVRVADVINRSFSGPSPTCEERNVRGKEWGVLKTTCTTWEYGWDATRHKVLPKSFWGKHHLRVLVGDSIITKAGPRHRVGVPAFVSTVEPRIIPSGKMICLRPDNASILPGFLALALTDRRTQTYLDHRTTGMAESQVNFENRDLLAAPLWVPDIEEQQRILQPLSNLDELIAFLRNRVSKARDLKQGMMQQLLTGRTRLPEADAA